jgi:guanine deaminase
MTLYRGTVLDTPEDPFRGGVLRADSDTGLLVNDGVIRERGPFSDLRSRHPAEDVVDLSDGLVLPGFVDTHVHFPQVRAIGGLGMPLLDWLAKCALPEEQRLADVEYARLVAAEFVSGLAQAGTTSALVFGAHFPAAVEALFAEAHRAGLRIAGGLVVSNRALPEPLLTTPDRAYYEGLALAKQWHDVGRLRYAVTPRFSLSCDDDLLAGCAALAADVPGALFTSHINENLAEVAAVAESFATRGGGSYLDTYDRHGLVGPHSVLAHNVHPTDAELAGLAARGATVAHCPTSNATLGSGLFPMRRHLEHGVRVALGSDVGAGSGFSLLKEGLQAYFVQQLLGDAGQPLTCAHLLHLATSAGAQALGLGELVGDLGVGRRFDAVWLSPQAGTTLDVALRNASSAEDALAKAFSLGGPADVRSVWVDGEVVGTPRDTASERAAEELRAPARG